MVLDKCPGTDLRYVRVEEQPCPKCGYMVEIFSNEIKVVCPKCKTVVYRENIPSCIDWCSYAKECIGSGVGRLRPLNERNRGFSPVDEPKGSNPDFKERILSEMINYFGDDIKRITHAMKVTHFA